MELPQRTQEYVDMITSGNAPWMEGKSMSQWSDSTKQQFFEIFNTELANDLELERWRLNNEYNTPRAQMLRMIEAGINPAAAYQQVSSGNSSSAPNTHQAGAAAFHDTSDRLQRINTVMNGISTIMNTIYGGIDAVKGIQDIGISHQANAINNLKYNYLYPGGYQLFGKAEFPYISQVGNFFGNAEDAKHFSNPIEVAPGFYMDGLAAAMFPELIPETGFSGGKYHQGQTSVDIQQQLADRRTRIDELIQGIMHGLETNASTEEMMKYFLQLFMYGAMSKFGGF